MRGNNPKRSLEFKKMTVMVESYLSTRNIIPIPLTVSGKTRFTDHRRRAMDNNDG